MLYFSSTLLIITFIPIFVNATNDLEIYQNINEKVKIMIEYFHWKSVRFGILINCFDNLVLKKIVRQFSNDMISIFIVKDHNTLENYINTKIDHHHIGVVLDLQCPLAISLLKYSAENDMFNRTYHWLIFNSNVELSNTMNKFKYINVQLDCDVLIIEHQLITNQWILTELYNPGIYHGGTLRYSYYGTWSRASGFTIFATLSKYEKRRDTGGLILRTSFVVRSRLKIPVLDFVNDEKYSNFDIYTKVHNTVVENVKHMYNFRYKYKRVPEWVHGLVENLVHKKLDIGTSGVFITHERLPLVHFTPIGLFPLRISFLFRHPRASSGALSDTFLRPLTYSVWAVSFLSSLLIITLLKVTTTTETRQLIKDSDSESTWNLAWFNTCAALLQQGVDRAPILFSGRLIIYVLLLFTLLLYQFYSASIVSSLLMDPPKTIKTLKDLLDSPLEVGLNVDPYIISWYQDDKDPIELQMYEKKIMREGKLPPHIYPLPTGMKKVHQGGFAYEAMLVLTHRFVSIENGWTEREICDLSKITMRTPQTLFFICQKKSPFRKLFNIGILLQAERGVASFQTKKWLREIPECTVDALSSSTFSVSFIETASAFVVLGLGLLMSVVIFLIEIAANIKNMKGRIYGIKSQ